MKDLKNRLEEYLEMKGIEIFGKGKNKKIHCLLHSENNPSAQVNKGSIVCHGCGVKIDIFDCANLLDGIKGFKNQVKHISNYFGINVDTESIQNRKHKPVFRVPVDHKESIELNINVARKVYCISRLNELAEYANIDGEFKKAWPYFTEKKLIKCVDVRYENPEGKKQVITVWYDGRNVKMANAPNYIWGLDKIDYKKPALIVEGAKCADLGRENLGDWFCLYTWNRGSNAVKFPNWEPIKKYEEVYFLCDHDQKEDREGNILPDEKQPGMKCALDFKKIVPQTIIVTVPDGVIKKFGDGCDLEQMISLMSNEDIKDHILVPF